MAAAPYRINFGDMSRDLSIRSDQSSTPWGPSFLSQIIITPVSTKQEAQKIAAIIGPIFERGSCEQCEFNWPKPTLICRIPAKDVRSTTRALFSAACSSTADQGFSISSASVLTPPENRPESPLVRRPPPLVLHVTPAASSSPRSSSEDCLDSPTARAPTEPYRSPRDEQHDAPSTPSSEGGFFEKFAATCMPQPDPNAPP